MRGRGGLHPGRSFDQCKQVQLNGCVNDVYLDAITANSITAYSIDQAEAAFTTFEQMAARCDPTVATWAAGAMRGIMQGTINPGGSCKPPSTLDRPVVAAHLAACREGNTTACRPVNLSQWTCESRAQVGGPCFTDLNCVDGLYCDNPQLRPTGATCKQRKADQSGCAAGNECMSLLCKGGVCVPATVGAAYCLAQ
jgi:hypothetical protein